MLEVVFIGLDTTVLSEALPTLRFLQIGILL
jgi:hypothetical protein